jgi:hypothetical protein
MKDLSQLNAFVEVKVNKMTWSGKLQDIVNINANDLNNELANQPAVVSWFGAVLAEAIATYEELKDRKERVYAELYLKYKEKDEKMGVKSTEARLNSLILTDSDYEKVQVQFNEMRKQVNVLKSISNSLEHRRDMLIQLSANIRRELTAGDYMHDPDGKGGE